MLPFFNLNKQIKIKNPITNSQDLVEKKLTRDSNAFKAFDPKTSIEESSISEENPQKKIAIFADFFLLAYV